MTGQSLETQLYRTKAHRKTTIRKAATDLIVPPYTEDFADREILNDFTIIDVNGDGKEWGYYNGTMKVNYNGNLDMDDWLITPAIKLESGRVYPFSIDARGADASCTERFEVKAGTAPTVAAMDVEVIPVTDVTKTKMSTFTGSITVSVSGIYHIGVHGCSPKDQYTLFIDNIVVSEPEIQETPSAVTDFSVVPNPDATLGATISFKAPELNVDGEPLTIPIDKIEVTRDGALIHTVESPAPQQECVIPDNVDAAGFHTYQVTPYISQSCGASLSANVYIGMARPGKPQNVGITETENDGEVTISWEPVTVNEYGHTINADLVSYRILDAEGETTIAEGVTGDSYTFRAVPENWQSFVEYIVEPYTEAGEGTRVPTPFIAAGVPYTVPMEIRVLPEGYISHNISVDGNWGLVATATEVDGDGYLFRLTTELNHIATLGTGKVAIPSDAKNPVFRFFYYTWKTASAGPSKDIVYVTVNGQRLEGVSFPLGDSDGWVPATVRLDDYKGQNIILGIEEVFTPLDGAVSYYPLFDSFSVYDLPDADLQMTGISAPIHAKTDNEMTVTMKVTNGGSHEVSDYTVNLYRDGIQVVSLPGTSLISGASGTFNYTDTPRVTWDESVTYRAEIVYEADNVTDNNAGETSVEIMLPDYPLPANVSATVVQDGEIGVNWSAPALTTEPETITDDFEKYSSFEINDAGEWRFADLDESKTYGIEEDFPGRFEPMAYIVMDRTHFNDPSTIETHSGDKCLASFSAQSGTNDDWLISPLLPGTAQTIKIYAKSYNDKYGLESFEILSASKENAVTDDFTSVRTVSGVPVSWKAYTCELPEGTRHFAVRCVSQDIFALLLDDITFDIAPETDRFQIAGYNIYRDGQQLNLEPIQETSYNDTEAEPGTHIYNVTAVYTRGESRLSEDAPVEMSRITDTASDANGIKLSVNGNTISVSGLSATETIIVFDVAGRVIASASPTSAGNATLTIPDGIYLVKATSTTTKVIIR